MLCYIFYVMLINKMRTKEVNDKIRTTVYLDKANKQNIDFEGLNLSELINDYLSRRYNDIEDIKTRLKLLRIDLDLVNHEILIMQKKKRLVLDSLKGLQESIKQFNVKIKGMKRLGVNEGEYNFLKEISRKYQRGGKIISDLKDYNERFNKEIKSEDFFTLIKDSLFNSN